MKTGNSILDKALQAQKGVGEVEVVKAPFYESPISYGALVNNTVYSSISYTYINVLLKDIEAAYNNWNKAIGILEKIADLSKDYNKQKLDGLKEQMYWLNDHGKQARGLDGMIKDAIIFKTGNYEDSPGAQQRINQVYDRYNQSYKSTVSKIEKAFVSAIYSLPLKDTRPLIEKLSPIINQFQPEQATLFTKGIKNHVKPEINLMGLEINILMQQPSDILQSYFTEPNQEEEAMLQELMKQLELMKQEQIKITKALGDKDKIIADKDQALADKDQALADKDQALADKDQALADKDHIIENQNEQIVELTNGVSTRDATINHLNNELSIKDETINTKDEIINNLNNDLVNKNSQINALNITIHELQEANTNDPRVNDLTHRLEIVSIQKEGLERTVSDRNVEIARFLEDIKELRDDKVELQQDKLELRTRNNELKTEKYALQQEKDKLAVVVDNLSTKIGGKKLFIDQVKVHYDEYETLMLGCDKCSQHVHHDFDWPVD